VLEGFTKYSGWESNIEIFKTLLPYFMVSWGTIQATRLAYAINPESIVPLYLSFIPLPLFIVFSKETHAYLSPFWLIITLSLHVRNLLLTLPKRGPPKHLKVSILVYILVYLTCITFMSFYFVDVTGVDRIFGKALTTPITYGEEISSIMTALLVTWILYFQEVSSKVRGMQSQPKAGSTPSQPALQQQQQEPPSPQTPGGDLVKDNSGLSRSFSTAIGGGMKYAIPFEELKFSEQDVLGKGASGVVFKGTYEGELVAIKRLIRDSISTKEAKILRYFFLKNLSYYH